MANAQAVTAADLMPHGWRADVCGHELREGDTVIALTIDGEYGADPYDLDPASSVWDSGCRLSDWICLPCFRQRGVTPT